MKILDKILINYFIVLSIASIILAVLFQWLYYSLDYTIFGVLTYIVLSYNIIGMLYLFIRKLFYSMEVKIIEKGKHYPINHLAQFGLNYIYNGFKKIKNIKISSSCLYKFNDEDDNDINKLYGFSIGYHHKNSHRFGWNCDSENNRINIFAYFYKDGVICSQFLTVVECDVFYKYELKYSNGIVYYNIMLNGNVIKSFCISHDIKKINISYNLGLYFGGNKKAPHDMILYYKK